MADSREFFRQWPQVVAKAWADERFKQELIADPRSVLAGMGLELPEGVQPKIAESEGDTQLLVLPQRPPGLAIEQLEGISPGASPAAKTGCYTLTSGCSCCCLTDYWER
jgi:hypothetical protein